MREQAAVTKGGSWARTGWWVGGAVGRHRGGERRGRGGR